MTLYDLQKVLGESIHEINDKVIKKYCDVAENAIALLKKQQKLIDDITQRRVTNGAFD